MSEPKNNQNLPRRDFIKTAGMGMVVSPLAMGNQSADASSSKRLSSQALIQLTQSGLLTHHELNADVVVVGGGMSGVCASIAAARNGARVVLVQDRSVLGGNASSEVRMHIVGADSHNGRSDEDARESGIIDELRLEDAVRNPQRSASMFDLLLYEWVKREENITLLLDTHCFAVEMKKGSVIQSVLASRHSTEDWFTLKAKLFVDCTGDGRLGAEAGADFRMGREAQSEYGESLAPEVADSNTLGSSILLMATKYDKPMPFKAPDWIHKFEKPLPHRGIGGYEYGYWWNEWGGKLNIIKDNEEIRHELLRTAMGIWDLIKNSGHYKDSENWGIDWMGAIPGKRESRRFIGDYVLREQDLKNGETFDDGVAFGGWGIDLHHPDGIHTDEPPFTNIKVPMYNIPFRSLYSRNVANLLFAGRNISATQVAFGSTRVMATCSVMGQAAGTAAALCAKNRCTPRELAHDGIKMLQQQLLKDDAYAIGFVSSDADDHARHANVKASSEKSGLHRAAMITNGIHRGVGQWPNRWSSNPEATMPQWIELRFDKTVRVREIHLVFDTGYHRELTLSHSDSVTRRVIRGPQPETVKDYDVQLLDGGSAQTIIEEKGNYQRKRIHKIKPSSANGIRINVHATNGSQSATLFEVRVYS